MGNATVLNFLVIAAVICMVIYSMVMIGLVVKQTGDLANQEKDIAELHRKFGVKFLGEK